MRKMKLNADELRVESFETNRAGAARGTVVANESNCDCGGSEPTFDPYQARCTWDPSCYPCTQSLTCLPTHALNDPGCTDVGSCQPCSQNTPCP